MKLSKFLILGLACFTVLGTTSCFSNDTPDEPSYSVEDQEVGDAHYLEFYIEGKLIATLVVDQKDTYADLLPFFPTIPVAENGIKGEWVIYDKDGVKTDSVYLKNSPVLTAKVEYYRAD